MVKVGMGEKNGVDVRLLIGQIGGGQLLFSVKSRNLGKQAKLEMVTQTVYCTRRKPTREIISAKVEALAKVKENLGALVFDENFVTANLVDPTVKSYSAHCLRNSVFSVILRCRQTVFSQPNGSALSCTPKRLGIVQASKDLYLMR